MKKIKIKINEPSRRGRAPHKPTKMHRSKKSKVEERKKSKPKIKKLLR